jgi:hypothetical protein
MPRTARGGRHRDSQNGRAFGSGLMGRECSGMARRLNG